MRARRKQGEPLEEFITLGPRIPLVPVTHFKRYGWKDEVYEMAWHLVGPTIKHNMSRGTCGYQLYCIAFIEGMMMAQHVLNDPELKAKRDGNPESTPDIKTGSIQEVGSESGLHYTSDTEERNL